MGGSVAVQRKKHFGGAFFGTDPYGRNSTSVR